VTYNLLLAGDLDRARLAAALAALASVPLDAVDVADVDAPERNWDVAVSCTCEPARGDVSWVLDLYLTVGVQARPTEEQAAAYLAEHLAVPVLFPAENLPPSAYWLAAPGGLRTRARVYSSEEVGLPVLTIDAVERPVPSLPKVPVAPQPEVIREHRVTTPVRDEFVTWLAMDPGAWATDEDSLWLARTRLGAWESLTVRMSLGWPPDGWYPLEYYREDLEVRDELAVAVERLPDEVASRLSVAVEQVDEAFRAGTREVDDPEELAEVLGDSGGRGVSRGWWWRRVPEPEPWGAAPG
jgi:hypothetical protein